jgi:hypothetical protein
LGGSWLELELWDLTELFGLLSVKFIGFVRDDIRVRVVDLLELFVDSFKEPDLPGCERVRAKRIRPFAALSGLAVRKVQPPPGVPCK